MSKIRIYGDASGYVDLIAPAVADNSEIDLSSPTFNGNVGIGTNTPNFPLTIETTNNYATASFKSSGNEVSVEFNNTSTNGRNYKLVSGGAGGGLAGGKFGIYDATAQVVRFAIDSNGRITMPYQPSFHIKTSTPNQTSANTDIPFTTALVNVGSHFNTSTYRFTAPIAGKYLINTAVLIDSSAPTAHNGGAIIMKNGLAYQTPWVYHVSGEYAQSYSSIIISLSENDYITVQCGYTSYTGSSGAHTWIMGTLLG
jgi:hypothetical protein